MCMCVRIILRTGALVVCVHGLQVSLQLVRGGEVTVAVLTGSVGGDVIALLTQLHVSPHVGHQPGRERRGEGR